MIQIESVNSKMKALMNRNILLVEPAYVTKFPPMGLMKISTYHKELGDTVKFIKGISENIAYDCYWDRIYISTMFTFNWKITIKTINHYKALVQGDLSRIYVGGIMATLMAREVWEETGIVPIQRTLNHPGMLDDNNNLIVDKMIPDYDLFNDSPQEYSLIKDCYFGYSTRGCPNKCDFCGVKNLEPDFIDYRGIKGYINKIKKQFGEKAHLVLFDNNILASKRLERVVNDLCDLGFEKGGKFRYLSKSGQLIQKERRVDFNQGIDARLLTENKIKLLSKLAINPMRIAFDHIKYKDIYCKRIELAANFNIRHLSNYILYNHEDTPEDLWNRLKVNIDLNQKYDLKIYSFPMKYMPLNAKNRYHISEPSWNWYYLRSIQRVLNVVKGIVMPGEDFFYRAFGHDLDEFRMILHMPENILMNRGRNIQSKERDWRNKYRQVEKNEGLQELIYILCKYRGIKECSEARKEAINKHVRSILDYYYNPVEEATLFN